MSTTSGPRRTDNPDQTAGHPTSDTAYGPDTGTGTESGSGSGTASETAGDTGARAAGPAAVLIERLDRADQLAGATALRERSYELLRPTPGRLVVDVGCGAGRAVGELHARGHRSVGIDPAEEMIAVARSRWPEALFQLGDAYRLPFGDGEVGGYRADKVFHLLDDPAAALREARRVLAPGGRIVLIGQDWDTLLIDSDDPALTRTIVHARADRLRRPFAARRFRSSLLDSGFADVQTEVRPLIATDATMLGLLSSLADHAHAAGAITAAQAAGWVAEQRTRGEHGRCFLVVAVIVAAATRTAS